MLPEPLAAIVELFTGLSEGERRELLVHYAERSSSHAPQPGEVYELEDVRHDAECTDTVGVHLRRDAAGGCHFRLSLGPEVQTLTRALGSILCEGLAGASPQAVLMVPETVIDQIAGGTLVRLRSRTVYYLLRRMQQAVRRPGITRPGDRD